MHEILTNLFASVLILLTALSLIGAVSFARVAISMGPRPLGNGTRDQTWRVTGFLLSFTLVVIAVFLVFGIVSVSTGGRS